MSCRVAEWPWWGSPDAAWSVWVVEQQEAPDTLAQPRLKCLHRQGPTTDLRRAGFSRECSGCQVENDRLTTGELGLTVLILEIDQ